MAKCIFTSGIKPTHVDTYVLNMIFSGGNSMETTKKLSCPDNPCSAASRQFTVIITIAHTHKTPPTHAHTITTQR